jgi:hypothetical protein
MLPFSDDALCDSSTGYVYDFFPDGRGDTNTIAASVGRLVDTIPRRDTPILNCNG